MNTQELKTTWVMHRKSRVDILTLERAATREAEIDKFLYGHQKHFKLYLIFEDAPGTLKEIVNAMSLFLSDPAMPNLIYFNAMSRRLL